MSTAAIKPQTQFAFRAQKTSGIIAADHQDDFPELPTYKKLNEFVRVYKYSANGRFFAEATNSFLRILNVETGDILQQIDVQNISDLEFSPKGTLLSTWERPKLYPDGSQYKNMKVWKVLTGEEVISLTQKSAEGWNFQFTDDENQAVRLVSGEVQIWNCHDFSSGIVARHKLDGIQFISVGPGTNSSIALFRPQKKAEPASVYLYSLASLMNKTDHSDPVPLAKKTFFKADKAQLKWNSVGNGVLFCTTTEVDNSNQSYYGESNLYLLSAVEGVSSGRVALDKEGPIHDFEWSPNCREFTVSFGYIPSKTVLFDIKHNVVFNFGLAPRNFVQFNPQGRLLLVAGFGNLAGTIDIWDRATLKKVASVEASNSSHCDWSPDGQYFMTATLSPRLRVDNGVKIWHCTGNLIYQKLVDELYQCSWRPMAVSLFPGFKQNLPTAPAASESVKESISVRTAVIAGGAYRPPHARGSETPTHYKREDQGGVASSPGLVKPRNKNTKFVPGAAQQSGTSSSQEAKNLKKTRRSKKDDQNESDDKAGEEILIAATEVPNDVVVPVEQFNANDKKIRALNKKLKAIEDIKRKRDAGEHLELTQMQKLETEAAIKEELKNLS